MRNPRHKHRRYSDRYTGYLWDEIEREEERPSRLPASTLSGKEPATPAQLTIERIEEAGRRLLAAARQVCAQYPPSKGGPYRVSFYGYSSLKSTIRQQKTGVAIRVSHLLLDAPEEVLAGVLHVLLARFHGRPVPKHLSRPYEDYCRRPEVEDRARRVRVRKGTKILVGPKGEVRDLDESFERVNRIYFGGRFPKPTLSWSPGVSRRRMGYYDEDFNTIVISSGLDSKRVPAYVLDYIMYHEMLHVVCPIRPGENRRQVHTKQFKSLERQYRYYDRALRWISKYWR